MGWYAIGVPLLPPGPARRGPRALGFLRPLDCPQPSRAPSIRSFVFLMTGLPSLKVASSIPQLHFTRGLDPYVGSKGESPLARDGVRHAVDLDAARFPGGDRSKSSTTKVTLALPCL